LIPGNIYVMDYLLTVCLKSSSIREQASLQLYILLVRGNQVAWLWTIVRHTDRVHTTIRRVTEVTVWVVAKRPGTLAIRGRLIDIDSNFQLPNSGFPAAGAVFVASTSGLIIFSNKRSLVIASDEERNPKVKSSDP
jgi:hypothetical protein